MKVRVKQSIYPYTWYIVYKRRWYSPWRLLQALPDQFTEISSRVPNSRLLCPVHFMSLQKASEVAAMFVREIDIDSYQYNQNKLYNKLYKGVHKRASWPLLRSIK